MTDIKFYINYTDFPYNMEVFAIFVNEVSPNDNTKVHGYFSEYGHTMIHIDYIKESRLATKQEYEKLYNELSNSVSYKLNVLN